MVGASKPIFWACAVALSACTSPRDTLPVAPETADAAPQAADAPGAPPRGSDAPAPDAAPMATDVGGPDRPASAGPGKALGAACAAAGECGGGSCVDGRCCAKSSCGVCQTCGPAGTCVPLLSAQDPDTCTGTRVCDEQAVCKTLTGEACTADSECLLGHCSHGLCCTSACSDRCQSCTVPGKEGYCQTITNVADPALCPAPGAACNDSGRCVLSDQQQLVGAGGDVGRRLGAGDSAVAQVVTAGLGGPLGRVAVAIDCDQDSTVGFEIQGVNAQGRPSGMVEVSAPDSFVNNFTPGSHINNFDLRDTQGQMAGDRRAVVIKAPAAGTYLVRTAAGDPYPGGKAFRMAAGSTSWEEIPADYAFQTWVLVP